MFEPSEIPRVFGLAPGIDFPKALADGLRSRMMDHPPEAMARVQLVVNTRRMQRRLHQIFTDGPAGFLPRITLLTDPGALAPGLVLPPSVSPLRRRLDLIALVSALLDRNPDLAPRASLYDLADSLAKLIDEMHGEGVSPEKIDTLDVSDLSGHWDRARQFLSIARSYIDQTDTTPDAEAQRRLAVDAIADHWRSTPPTHPIIIAGSTASRGTTLRLVEAVAALPQGAIVLPGLDFDMPRHIWAGMTDANVNEDHPQFRFRRLLDRLGLGFSDVQHWANTVPPSPDRNKLISLSLLPAPVTDIWRTDGPKLGDLTQAVNDMTLVEAESPRLEAMAIALRLRKAVKDGQSAALITPDRMLTRRVSAALTRWGIEPDDSAGMPLQLSPPGRFLRHVAELFTKRFDAEMLLVLLKHPLTHSGEARNLHQLNTEMLELEIRRHGLPYPDAEGLNRLIARINKDDALTNWRDWIIDTVVDLPKDPRPLSDWIALHLRVAEALALGSDDATESALWRHESGEIAQRVMTDFAAEADDSMVFSARDYGDLVGALLSAEEVRNKDRPHPNVMIWGQMEARVQGADLVILGGLNDGTWPEAPAPDPWLNRKMRAEAGLLLPERQVGLAAHDYQQAVCAPEVWLTRARRSEDAETVPSRWVNRLTNLMRGLAGNNGPEALTAMRDRGDWWLQQVTALEAVDPVDPAPRPCPSPPINLRPRQISVTEVQSLIRDPYAVYARHVLRLRPLDPIKREADARMRGTMLHEVLERFVKDVLDQRAPLAKEPLLETVQQVLTEIAPWPTARIAWLARMSRIADWFVETEHQRLAQALPVAMEKDAQGILKLSDMGITLICRADRIDLTSDGAVHLYDYKTGDPPSAKAQTYYDKQLLIEAAMIEEGSFVNLGARQVNKAAYIGLGSTPKEVLADLEGSPAPVVLEGLRKLLSFYLLSKQGFTSRRAMEKERFDGDYDHLARYGEWDVTAETKAEDIT